MGLGGDRRCAAGTGDDPRAGPTAAEARLLTATGISLASQHYQLLDLGDRLGRVQPFRAGLGAVHDRVAAIEAERVFERVKALPGALVAAVGDPAIGLQQYRRPQIALAVPPIARAGGRAAEAQDAFPQPVEPIALGDRLRPLAVGRRRLGAVEPGLDRA